MFLPIHFLFHEHLSLERARERHDVRQMRKNKFGNFVDAKKTAVCMRFRLADKTVSYNILFSTTGSLSLKNNKIKNLKTFHALNLWQHLNNINDHLMIGEYMGI
jgi:hypothetical protein